MKKRKTIIIDIVNICLVMFVVYTFLTIDVKKDTVKQNFTLKKLSTSLITKIEEKSEAVMNETEEGQNEQSEEPKEEKETNLKENNRNTNTIEKTTIEETKKIEEPQQEITPTVQYPTYTGKYSYYYANCTGCSGITSTGVDVSDGKIYYEDKQYGKVRIIAAGTEIPKWSIVRINNSTLGSNALAIVLDRGGDIGEGRKFLIDILTNNNENLKRTNQNITVEVIRQGR